MAENLYPQTYTLRLGFCGKRIHPALSTLSPGLHKFFEAVAEVKAGDDRVIVQLINGLSMGADQISANAFLKDKFIDEADKQLIGVIAFEDETYKKESVTYEYIPQYEELKHKCLRIYEINSTPGDMQAYAEQSRMIVAQSDVLIACVDPEDNLTAGGSIDGIYNALRSKIPVILFSLNQHHHNNVYVLQEMMQLVEIREQKKYPEPDKNFSRSKEVLISILKNQGWPSISDEGGGPSPKQLFNEITSTHEKPTSRWDFKLFGWDRLVAVALSLHPITKNEKEADPESPAVSSPEIEADKYWRLCDNQAGYFTNLYRNGYVANYMLTIIAVLLALISLNIISFAGLSCFRDHTTDDGNPEVIVHICEFVIFILTLLKIFILLKINKNLTRTKEGNWMDKSLRSRYLSERFRILHQLSRLGILRSCLPHIGVHNRNHEKDVAIDRLYRKLEGDVSASENEVLPKTIKINTKLILKRIRNEWLLSQLAYHTAASQRMQAVNTVLEEYSKKLSSLVIGFVMVDVVLVTGGIIVGYLDPDNLNQVACFIKGLDHWLAVPLISLTALIPVVVASFNAIRNQSEAKKLSARSYYMIKLLNLKMHDIDTVINSTAHHGNYIKAVTLIEDCAQLMLDEVADWVIIYEKEIHELG